MGVGSGRVPPSDGGAVIDVLGSAGVPDPIAEPSPLIATEMEVPNPDRRAVGGTVPDQPADGREKMYAVSSLSDGNPSALIVEPSWLVATITPKASPDREAESVRVVAG